jgi:VIT1/CCC1 family predicted Fe2+/Mn2+ transporter
MQAAVSSALAFAAGAILPVIAALAPRSAVLYAVPATALVLLGVLGALGAKAGGAPIGRAMIRVVLLGVLAMGMTALIGAFTGAVV